MPLVTLVGSGPVPRHHDLAWAIRPVRGVDGTAVAHRRSGPAVAPELCAAA